jgi:hypothetical protein
MEALSVFYKKIFEEHEFENAPDLYKYYDNEGNLTVKKEIIYDMIKLDIEELKKITSSDGVIL